MRLLNFNPFKLSLLICTLVIASHCSADETKIRAFIKGSFQDIQLANQDTPYIVTFWSENCDFCMKELALFGKVLKQHPKIKLISITTDPFLEAKKIHQILASKNLVDVQKWVFADDHVERLYFDIARGWRGELPLTYFAGGDNKIVKHLGVINEKELVDWLTLQSGSIVK